jgi:hypothetical protein
MSIPTEYAYKITPTEPPSPIPAEYPLSDLDKKDGFIHLSTSWQVSLWHHIFLYTTPGRANGEPSG